MLQQQHSTIVELLGVYALDAVDQDERNLIEHHLDGCSQCLAEVRDHYEVAALLASDPVQPPTRVWDGIVVQIDAPRPAAQQATVIPLQRRTASILTSSRWVASVAAAVLVALTAGVVTQSQRIGDLNSRVADRDQQISTLTASLAVDPLQQAVAAAIADPAAQVADLTADGSSATMSIVVLPDGTGYVYQSNLEALPSDATYQLWAVVDDKVISAGVLGNQPAVIPFHVDSERLRGLVVTQEVAGGVPQSKADPVVAWFKA